MTTAHPADRALTAHLAPPVTGAPLDELASLLGVSADAPPEGAGRPVEIVDVGANPLVGEPPTYTPLLDAGLARLTGFEPQPEALAALLERRGTHERFLGLAVGDGAEHDLRICAEAGFAGLLEPDVEQLRVLTDFPELATVTDRVRVPTVRLDDVAEIERADLLVLDAQGSELAILQHAGRLLTGTVTDTGGTGGTGGTGDTGTSGTVAVQVEVAFHRLYTGAPVFAEVDLHLRAAGFVPHTFVTTRTWPLAPVAWADPLEARSRHLVEADMLYVRDPARLPALGVPALRAGVLIAVGAYGCLGLGLVLLRELVQRGSLAPSAEADYRRLVAPFALPRRDTT